MEKMLQRMVREHSRQAAPAMPPTACTEERRGRSGVPGQVRAHYSRAEECVVKPATSFRAARRSFMEGSGSSVPGIRRSAGRVMAVHVVRRS